MGFREQLVNDTKNATHMAKFSSTSDRAPNSRQFYKRKSGPEILGEREGNSAFRAGIRLDKSGVATKDSATDAIRYRVISKAGRDGFRTTKTGRYRHRERSPFNLTQATNANVALGGIAQSSVYSETERYQNKETRSSIMATSDHDKRWGNPGMKFKKEYPKWKELKINNRWKHYSPLKATMFKQEDTNKGAARRSLRTIL